MARSHSVPISEAHQFGIIEVDALGRMVAFDEKPRHAKAMPGRPDMALASMGVYVFNADLLFAELARDAADTASTHDFGRDLIPRLIGDQRVYAHRFASSCINSVDGRPYWRDVGTVDAYWEANMDLTRVLPELNLYDDTWPILSQIPQLPPAKFVFDEVGGRRGFAVDSLVASGCIVSGALVRRSVLFCKARVDEGSLVEDSLVLPDTRIGRGVTLRRAIVDKRCRLPDGFTAGVDRAADLARGFHVTPSGITLVTQAMLEADAALATQRAAAGA
jgi:glucose-1-phosphate adenylyltransferase